MFNVKMPITEVDRVKGAVSGGLVSRECTNYQSNS